MSEPGWKTNMDNHNMESLARLHRRVRELEAGLESIAKNTCCDKCQEAALVARALLKDRS